MSRDWEEINFCYKAPKLRTQEAPKDSKEVIAKAGVTKLCKLKDALLDVEHRNFVYSILEIIIVEL